MKKPGAVIFVFLLIGFTLSCKAQENNDLKLWYEHAASVWEEALPIGNGRLGAMIFGGPAVDRIQFNEETLWAGSPHDYSHEGAYDHLSRIRELLWQGRQDEAEKLALEKFMSVPLRQQKYQPFGDIFIISRIMRQLRITDGNSIFQMQCAGHPTGWEIHFLQENILPVILIM